MESSSYALKIGAALCMVSVAPSILSAFYPAYRASWISIAIFFLLGGACLLLIAIRTRRREDLAKAEKMKPLSLDGFEIVENRPAQGDHVFSRILRLHPVRTIGAVSIRFELDAPATRMQFRFEDLSGHALFPWVERLFPTDEARLFDFPPQAHPYLDSSVDLVIEISGPGPISVIGLYKVKAEKPDSRGSTFLNPP